MKRIEEGQREKSRRLCGIHHSFKKFLGRGEERVRQHGPGQGSEGPRDGLVSRGRKDLHTSSKQPRARRPIPVGSSPPSPFSAVSGGSKLWK